MNKRRIENKGQVNQYYVQNNHEAIIDEETWQLVQLEFERRKAYREQHHLKSYVMQSKNNPFLSKVFCAECGGAFGRKNWTTSRGIRPVRQCNNRYRVKEAEDCANCHIDEESLQKAFMEAVHILHEYQEAVREKWKTISQGDDLLLKHFAKKGELLLQLETFDAQMMCQVLDYIQVEESGQITVVFLEGTEVDL